MGTLWIDTVFSAFDVVTSGVNTTSLMGGFTSDEQTRANQMTLLRTIIRLDVAPTVHDSGESSRTISMGIGLASQEAFAALTLPDANVATDFPRLGWIWRTRGRVFGFAADQPAAEVWRIDLDLRAQRKLENGVAYFIAHNDANEGATVTVRIDGIIRQLWLMG